MENGVDWNWVTAVSFCGCPISLHLIIVSQERLEVEYKQAVNNIKGLAEEQYQLALMKERNERRCIAGEHMLPGYNDVLHEEQQNIMNQIKQGNNSNNSARIAESPTDERGPTNGFPHHHESEPQSSLPRDRPWSRTLSSPDRRRYDSTTRPSRDREDQAPPPPRRHNTDQQRPALSDIFTNTEDSEEPPPPQQHPPSRPSSGRPRSNSEKPWDSSKLLWASPALRYAPSLLPIATSAVRLQRWLPFRIQSSRGCQLRAKMIHLFLRRQSTKLADVGALRTFARPRPVTLGRAPVCPPPRPSRSALTTWRKVHPLPPLESGNVNPPPPLLTSCHGTSRRNEAVGEIAGLPLSM